MKLCWLNGVTEREAMKKLGISKTALHERLEGAKKKFKKILKTPDQIAFHLPV